MPVKMNREDPPLTTVFGKAKWFAFVDETGRIEIRENPYAGSGAKTVAWLIVEGADRIVTQHIGGHPFMMFQNAGVSVCYPGEGRITVSEAMQRVREGLCEPITTANVMQFARH